MNEHVPVSALERLHRRLQMLIGRGRIKIGDDSASVQTQQVQVSDREIHDDMPRISEYGFTSMPLPECQAIVIFVAGERTNGVICGTNDERHRKTGLQPGEVALYDDLGQSIHLTRNGIVINGAGLPISFVNTPSITHDGVPIGNTHKHGGVTPGAASTSTPE